MVKLKNMMALPDRTLADADLALEERAAASLPRGYFGMSSAADCRRKNYLQWTFADREIYNADTLKRFDDGHRTEDLAIKRLRMAKGITIVEQGDDGRQIEVVDHDGHFIGHLDGKILGLRQAPKTWHVLEIKCTAEKNFKRFQKYKYELGEKEALRQWNHTYYIQQQLYMHYTKMTRSYMVVLTPGGRAWDSCRTDYSKEDALYEIERAGEIINNIRVLPAMEGNSLKAPPCLFCGFKAFCYENQLPKRHCRTCVWSRPVDEGMWHCDKHETALSYREQMVGCDNQLFRPEYVKNATINDVGDEFIVYDLREGGQWTDEGHMSEKLNND